MTDRRRRNHPQWAFQPDVNDWRPAGRINKRQENYLFVKQAAPQEPQSRAEAWANLPPARSRRAGGGGRATMQDSEQEDWASPNAGAGRNRAAPVAKQARRRNGGGFEGGADNSPNRNRRGRKADFSPSTSYDPFYQPPPKQPPIEHGRRVTFYKNGEEVFRGLPLSINRTFASFGSLLTHLTREFGLNCQRIFQIPQGFEIYSLNDFEQQGHYVVSDRQPLDRSCNYGGLMHPIGSKLSVNKSRIGDDYDDYDDDYDDDDDYEPAYDEPSPVYSSQLSQRGSKRAEDIPLYREYDPHDTLENYPVATIRLINNLNRTAHVEVSLSGNKKTFKMLLHEFGQFFGLRDCSVWTSRLPCKKVTGLGQLYSELEKNPQFLVCGSEEMPTEAASGSQILPPVDDGQSGARLSRSLNNGQRSKDARHSIPPINNLSPDEDRLIRRNMAGKSVSPSIVFSPQGAPSRSEMGPTGANHVGTVGANKAPAPKPIRQRRKNKGGEGPRFSDGSDMDDYPTGASNFVDTFVPINEQPMSPIRAARSYETLNRRKKTDAKAPVQAPGGRPTTKRQLLEEGKIKRRVGLRLEWVYGYRGKDARENLFFLPSGELMYHVGVVAVVYDPVNEEQRHYKGHTEDINCMALHPTDPLVATGQISPVYSDQQEGLKYNPHVRVWNYQSLNTVSIIGLGVFQASICCVGFSPDGNKLLVLDEGDRHGLSVWRWSEDKQLAQTPTTSDTVVWGKFCPNDPSIIITFGKEHIYFWRLAQQQNSLKLVRDTKSGNFTDQFPKPKFVTAATFLPHGELITGDSNGTITVWSRDGDGTYTINPIYSNSTLQGAHKKSVFSIVVTGPNHVLSGGGLEIKAWEIKDGKVVNTGSQSILESSGFIRSLVVGKNNMIFAGTTKNCILEGALLGKFRYIVQGHSDEVWALSCHSKDSTFVTGGYDSQLIKWFAPIHRSVWRTPLEKQCLSVAFHPTEDVVAIGTSIGRLVVLNSYNGMHICSVQMAGSTDLLSCIQYAPEGDMIVCGSQDGPIYVSLVEDGGRIYRRHKAGIIENALGAVQNIDWHEEVAELIQISTKSANHAFATIEDMKLVKVEAKAVNDEWSTYTCPTGKLVKGIMNRLKQGEEMTACDMVSRKSPIAGLIASSTSYGRILLTASRKDLEIDSKLLESRMCSHNITALRFTSDGRYLIAVGGKDGIIYQYATTITELWGGNNAAAPSTH